MADPAKRRALDEPELHLHGHVIVPDLAGWRRERMPEQPDAAAFELAPDWICEVLSPSTSATDRADKMPIYATERVSHVYCCPTHSPPSVANIIQIAGVALA